MAKLLPLLTAAVMIGVLGGALLWLIVPHRESVALQAGPPPSPTLSVPDDEGGSQPQPTSNSSNTAAKSSGQSLPTPSVDEPLTPRPNPRTLPAELASDSSFSSGAPPAGPVQTTSFVHPGAARASAPVSSAFGKAPPTKVAGGIDEALTFALEAADPYVKEGFTVREDYWGGDLPLKQPKAVVHQLFQGNSYWFWMGTDQDGAKIAVHVYDSEGRLAEAESWQKPHKAAAMVVPKQTGTYYLIVEVEKAPAERTFWALVYGYR